MIHLGVDIGIRKIAVGSPLLPYSSSIDLGKKPGDRQAETLMLTRFLRDLPSTEFHLWIERPYMSSSASNPDTSIGMGETVGIIRSARQWAGVTMVHQSSWKAQVLGNGKAGKDEIRAFLEEHHPKWADLCLGVEDRYDAMCIGIYGTLVDEGTIDLPVPKSRKRKKTDARRPQPPI